MGKVLNYLNESNKNEKGKLYREFFREMLKRFNVKSPSELSREEKIEFFNTIELEWKADKK